MDASEPDVAARGRALFEQLRAEREGNPPEITGSSGDSVIAAQASDDHAAERIGQSVWAEGTIDATDHRVVGQTPDATRLAPDTPLAARRVQHDEMAGVGGEIEPGGPGDPLLLIPVTAGPPEYRDTDPPPASPGAVAGDGGKRSDDPPADSPTRDSRAGDSLAGDVQAENEPAGDSPAPDSPAPDSPAPDSPAPDSPDPDSPGGTDSDSDGLADKREEHEVRVHTAASPKPDVGLGVPGPGPDPTFHVEQQGRPDPASPPTRLPHPAAALPLPRIVAIANQKGGVGKTTTAVNLGAALAELGYRTLVVDLDPQGNATTGLGINARNLDNSIYDVLMREMAIDECIEPTSVRNLFVAPATIDLAGAEIELVPAFSRELRLKRALAEVADSYEFTIIDCPPSLGLLTVNGLAAATEVIVPIQCEYYALEGLSQLMRNVNLVQSNLNPTLLLSAIILTMYDARTKLAEQVANEVRDHFGARVCRHVVPRTVRLSEAPSFGQPIIVFDPSSRGALAYRELAKEVSGGTPQRVG